MCTHNRYSVWFSEYYLVNMLKQIICNRNICKQPVNYLRKAVSKANNKSEFYCIRSLKSVWEASHHFHYVTNGLWLRNLLKIFGMFTFLKYFVLPSLVSRNLFMAGLTCNCMILATNLDKYCESWYQKNKSIQLNIILFSWCINQLNVHFFNFFFNVY